MPQISDIISVIQHLESQDIDSMLKALYTKLKEDVRLSNTVQFDVKPKRMQGEDLVAKIKLYQGPDKESQDVLEANFARWSLQPDLFWKTSGEDIYFELDAQAQISRMKQRVACLVLVDFRDGIGRPSVEDTATILYQTGIIPTTLSKAIKTVNTMVDTGHRYRNLELNTTPGLCLVLGTLLPESCWTKNKSGPAFEAIKDRVSQTKTSAMATQYSELQKKIVKAELARVQGAPTTSYETSGSYNALLSPMPLFNEAVMGMDLPMWQNEG
ncbi:hypothetical protein Q7P35_000832 [Cladosporium inversicolor]